MNEKLKNMTEAGRVNFMAVAGHIFFMAIILLAYLAEVIKGSRTWGYFGVLAFIIIATAIIELAVYAKDNTAKAIRHIISITFGCMYVYLLFTAANNLIFVYVIPVAVLITMYCDVRFCTVSLAGVFLINLADVVYKYFKDGFSGQDMEIAEIQVLVMLLFGIYTIVSTQIALVNSSEKLDNLQKEGNQINGLLDTVMSISGQMTEKVNSISDRMQKLADSSERIRSAMQEVSSGSTETANSIQEQLLRTEDIQKNIDDVGNVSNSISESMKSAIGEVDNGKKSVDSLMKQVKMSEDAGDKVVKELNDLKEQTKSMQSIIELITSVASQTSLLSLNASIEAARAGEAGRGFAVVASEISNLANQTHTATDKITDLINDVTDKLQGVVLSVDNLMESNKAQNVSAGSAASNFEKITVSTAEANEQTVTLKKAVTSLVAANKAIVDSIQTVSAITEEVSANANETYTASDENRKVVKEVGDAVAALSENAKQLSDARNK